MLGREPQLEQLDAARREIDGGHLGAGARVLDEIRAEPGADLEQSLPAKPVEFRDVMQERMAFEAGPFGVGEGFRCATGEVRELRPAWARVPEVADLVLEDVVGCAVRWPREGAGDHAHLVSLPRMLS